MVQLPLTLLLAALHLAAPPADAQEQKAPEELQIQGRWKDGVLETRVGTAPWVAKGQDLLDQLRAAGAKPETSLVLDLPADLPAAATKELLDLLKNAKYSKVEVDGEVAVVVKAKPGKKPPEPQTFTPLRIEIQHGEPDCAPYAKGPGCPNARHWTALVQKTSCKGRSELSKVLREEAAAEPDWQVSRLSPRPVTVWADGQAPSGLVIELGLLCQTAGFFKVATAGPAETGAKAPDLPGPAVDDDKAPLYLRLGIRWKEGAAEVQVDKDPWTASDAAWGEQLHARKPSKRTHLQLDPDGDLPWSVTLRVQRLLETWGYSEIGYKSCGFLLEGPVETTAIGKFEAEGWAQFVEKSIRAGDPDIILRSIYRDELLRRTIGSLRFSVGMLVNFGRLTDPATVLGPLTPKEPGQSPPLHFLSLQEVDGTFRPLFRLLQRDRSDYVAFVLGKMSDGTLRIVDLYSLSSGECLSEIVRSNYLRDPASLEYLNMLHLPVPDDMAVGMGKAGQMMMFLLDQKPLEALDYYAKNEADLKKDKVAHRLRIRISRMVGTEEYRKALEDFERDLPGDPSHTILRMERHLLDHDHVKGLAAVDALDRAVQGDSFLDVMRAQFHLLAKDYDKARSCAEGATVSEPTLDQGWWMTIGVCLAQKDYAATARYLTATEKALKIGIADLTAMPLYADFVKSAEYAEWLKLRR